MHAKKASAVILFAVQACFGAANAQISMPSNATALGLQVGAPTQPQTPGIVTLGEAALSSNQIAKGSSVPAQASASAVANKPVQAQAAPGPAQQLATPSQVAGAASAPPAPLPTFQPGAAVSNMPPAAAPLPTPFPSMLNAQSRLKPDVELVRISSKNGVQQATLYVRGMTRPGLTVGSKVLKLVISEFRDDGVCLDASLHKPKCATFVTAANE
ncbi:hypothetical protein LPN04_31440 [Rugamonas sp. A1-17]|nr:hypothetical protein [Rugamonas sp. A1-17]